MFTSFADFNFLGDSLKAIPLQNRDLVSQASVVLEDRAKHKDIFE